MSLQFTAYNTVAYDEISPERMASANSFYMTFQQLMMSLGICVGAMALTASQFFHNHPSPLPIDFSVAFLTVTAISILASPVNRNLPVKAGSEMVG